MNYDDIINLPHYVSAKRPQMSMEDRAAQFSPFAALVGYEDGIAETNRQVEQLAELNEDYLQELDEKLQYIQGRIDECPLAEITYFEPDETKRGGAYKTVRGNVKRIDGDKRQIVFSDKRTISLNLITAINFAEPC